MFFAAEREREVKGVKETQRSGDSEVRVRAIASFRRGKSDLRDIRVRGKKERASSIVCSEFVFELAFMFTGARKRKRRATYACV